MPILYISTITKNRLVKKKIVRKIMEKEEVSGSNQTTGRGGGKFQSLP